MIWTGTLLAAALAVIAYAAWWLLKVRHMPLGNWIGVVALAIWLTGISIAWFLRDEGPRRPTGRTQSIASLAWPATESPARAAGVQDAGVQAAPVASLVTGLEARLAKQPDDREGWMLLAQSYAYTSNEAAAERAIRRAVELGADETMLRNRVAAATRSVHSSDLVEQAREIGPVR